MGKFAIFVFSFALMGFICESIATRKRNSTGYHINSTKQRNGNGPVPIVLWHGMGDSCCNPLSMGYIKSLLEQEINGVYVHSLMIGDSWEADTAHGFFLNVNTQIEIACSRIRNDTKLQGGYHAVGFSQGGQFLRGLVQRCPSPPMLNLVSIGGQHQGVYGLPYCIGTTGTCEVIRHLLDKGAYESFVQNNVVQAEYWHDPMNEAEYRAKSVFLADINNERHQNDTYKKNLLSLQKLVLVKFGHDLMVEPKETEWFGFYAEGNDTVALPMEQTKLYTEDRLGLKTLKDTGRLHLLEFPGNHLQIPHDVFIKSIIDPFLK